MLYQNSHILLQTGQTYFFENSYKLKSRISFDQSSKSNRNKWFNKECMRKREAYKTAVFEFNLKMMIRGVPCIIEKKIINTIAGHVS